MEQQGASFARAEVGKTVAMLEALAADFEPDRGDRACCGIHDRGAAAGP